MTDSTQPVQHVHVNQGRTVDRTVQCARPEREPLHVPTIADLVPLTEIMSRDMTCAHRELDGVRVAELMIRNHIGCMPVVGEAGRPVGMITKLDIVERLVGNGSGRPGRLEMESAETLMMPLSIALDEHATVAHAAALMANEDIHHLFVIDAEGHLVGVVSTMDIVRWLAKNDGFVPTK